jgi:hypothetical protein
MYFDGKDTSVITIPQNATIKFTSAMTAEMWVKRPNGQVDAGWEKALWAGNPTTFPYGAWGFQWDMVGQNWLDWKVTTQNGPDVWDVIIRPGIDINDGNWHHVAGVFDNGIVKYYIDGVDRCATMYAAKNGGGLANYGCGTNFGNTLNQTSWGTAGLGIGGTAIMTYMGAKGTLDEIALYNVGLPLATVREHCAMGKNGDQTDLSGCQ